MNKSEQIRVLLNKGLSAKDIAARVGVSPAFVYTTKWQLKNGKVKKKAGVIKKKASASVKVKKAKSDKAYNKAKSDKAYNEYRSRVDLNALDTTDSASYWGRLPAPDTDPNSKSALGFLNEILARRAEDEADLSAQQIDWVNSPSHYKVGGIETIDFIEAKGLGYNLGNVVKYITRADHKGNREQDLNKALWYLTREIQKYSEV